MGRLDAARVVLGELAGTSEIVIRNKFAHSYAHASIDLAEGGIDSAITYATRCNKAMEDLFGMMLLAEIMIANGDYGVAAAAFEQVLSVGTYWRSSYGVECALANFALAEVYEQLGDHRKAVERYEEFLRIWAEADESIVEIDSARVRLQRLRDAP